jgi:hypothetical protein
LIISSNCNRGGLNQQQAAKIAFTFAHTHHNGFPLGIALELVRLRHGHKLGFGDEPVFVRVNLKQHVVAHAVHFGVRGNPVPQRTLSAHPRTDGVSTLWDVQPAKNNNITNLHRVKTHGFRVHECLNLLRVEKPVLGKV